MEKQQLITNIQRMCFHDGPGIRTTVFLKGCSLHCPWCSNPENIHFGIEKYMDHGRECVYGREYTVEELVRELIKDKDYWATGGGVTFSGGEALMQANCLKAVLQMLKEQKIHTAVETALFIPTEYLEEVLPLLDYFIVDVKILDKKDCKDVLGGELDLYRANVEKLYRSGKLKKFRIPCCYEYTFHEQNKKLLKDFLTQYGGVETELFPLHDLGSKKYAVMDREVWKHKQMAEEDLREYCEELKCCGICARIIKIS